MLKNSFGDHAVRRRRRRLRIRTFFNGDVTRKCVDEKIYTSHCRPAWVKLSRFHKDN
jgi:hypothetical protein